MSDITKLLAAEAVRQQPTHQPAFAELVRSRRKRARRNRFVIGAAMLLALSAVGGSVLFKQQPTVPSAPSDGAVVTGVLLTVGGPVGTPSGGLAGTVEFQAADGTVTAAEAASDGRFSITVSPGQYIVTGDPLGVVPPSLIIENSSGVVTSRSPSAGYSRCRADAPVTVPASGLSGVQVICHIR
ncbi:hypothetical protein [Dactylosporangium sp. NPDC051484]|uniref:hypothetical protein n=1 Tax=Dactylosporangium sp. NPDC051484 TaxID=3154942 RepID=UPI00344FC708